ncbi:MAG: hypothetical protein G01um101429_258 [Parcubacteria group bacterium Gr01-1014_29]|nr:MAG: hypothetical protein G01um101429_258 [Parcubacteria group bacterium Gr01-1014_29]
MQKQRSSCFLWLVLLIVLLAGCASGPLTKREKGALLGGAGGAGVGALLGGGKGAVIGGALGGLGGALLGDQFQRREQEQWEQQRELENQQREIERQRKDLERLKRHNYYKGY